VTITDHNRIEGALEIAHLPRTFISEEVTSYFPADRCKVHVLAYDITEKQHVDIQHLRKNIFELVEYLRKSQITHALAHPLYSVNGRLTVAHFEQLLLLFQNFELNGDCNPESNNYLKRILSNLAPEDISRFADKHDIAPYSPAAWRKNFIGGSDDHSSLNIARTYTDVAEADSMQAVFHAIGEGRAEICCRPASPQTVAHNFYSIAYQFYRSKFGLERFAGRDFLLRFLERSLLMDTGEDAGFISKLHFLWHYRRNRARKQQASDTLLTLLRSETSKLIREDPRTFSFASESGAVTEKEPENHWFQVVDKISNRIFLHFADHLLDHLSGANIFSIFHTIGSAGGFYSFLAPYFVAFAQFGMMRQLNQALFEKLDLVSSIPAPPGKPCSIGIFCDAFFESHQSTLALQQRIRGLELSPEKITVITCGANGLTADDVSAVKNFAPFGGYEFKDRPTENISYPPFLDVLDYCYSENISSLFAAAPGPMGLAALIIARLLKLPLYGIYQTILPQYAREVTGDEVFGDLARKYSLWFYNQTERLYTFSQEVCRDLTNNGIARDKIHIMPPPFNVHRLHAVLKAV